MMYNQVLWKGGDKPLIKYKGDKIMIKKMLVVAGTIFSISLVLNVQLSEVQASEPSNDKEATSLSIDMNLNTESSKKASNEEGTLMITKVDSPNNSRMRDGVYELYYHSWDGRFNVGYRAIIAADKFISVSDNWYTLYGMNVLYHTLQIDNPKQATYFLNVTNGWTSWNQYLRGTINMFGQLSVRLYKG